MRVTTCLKRMILMPLRVGLLQLCVFTLLICSCSNSVSHINGIGLSDSCYSRVEIDVSPEFYDSVFSLYRCKDIVVLKEDDATMFADIDKVIDANDKFYILDQTGYKTVVSFTHSGEPRARYGSVGQGPGEYVLPWDLVVFEEYVYVLDLAGQKLIRYCDDGKFFMEKDLPFSAYAFNVLNSGKILFNIMPSDKSEPKFCISDSTLSEFKFFSGYPDGFLGGLHTGNIFRTVEDKTYYYRAPTDTLIWMDQNGIPEGGIVFDFKERSLDEIAKKDYSKVFRKDLSDKLWFVDTPIQLHDDLWLGFVENGQQQFTIFFSPSRGKCGGREFNSESSALDIIEPRGIDMNGAIISVIDAALASECQDYNNLDENIRIYLEDGYRALLLHDLIVR